MLFLLLKEIKLLYKYKNIWFIKFILLWILSIFLFKYYNLNNEITFTHLLILYFIYLYIICVNLNYFLFKEKENFIFDLIYLSPTKIYQWYITKCFSFFLVTELPQWIIIYITNISLFNLWNTDYSLILYFMLYLFFSLSLSLFISLMILVLKQNNILSIFLILIFNLPLSLLINNIYEYEYNLSSIIFLLLFFIYIYSITINYLFKHLID